MNFTDWSGLTGSALVWLWLAQHVPLARRLHGVRRVGWALAVYGLVMLPLAGLSLAGWLRGLIGDLSLPSLLLLGASVYARVRGRTEPLWDGRERFALMVSIALLALLLYPFALGLGPLDPYRAGYGSAGLLLMLALLALWAMRRGLTLLPLALAVAVAAWSIGWGESTNLWDYVLDAPLAVYALVSVGRTLWKTRGMQHARAESQ
ncbi:MAG: hypothetical protein Fur0040_01310 [Sideroxydans sp.]